MQSKAIPKVFISHISQERQVARVLHDFLVRVYGSLIEVFNAFDGVSIPAGEPWFDHIIKNLSQSDVVLVLVSHESRSRPWLNFEAGFGRGKGALVVVVPINNFPFSKLDQPLAGFQGLSAEDILNLISTISSHIEVPVGKVYAEEYFDQLRIAEANLKYKSLVITPYISGGQLRFELSNDGNTDIEMLMFECSVPVQFLASFTCLDTHSTSHAIKGEPYRTLACTSARGAFGRVEPSLRPILTPGMGIVGMDRFFFVLKKPDEAKPLRDLPIYYQLHAIDYRTTRDTAHLAKLETRS